jgi:RNA polymerase sigma-70 factor, ECF subfamily
MSREDDKENEVHAVATHLRPIPKPADQLEGLFREHYDLVFRTAFRITGSAVDAEDVLQTIFLRLARRDSGLDLAPSPAAYLHRAAVNAALDTVRSRARERRVDIDEEGAAIPASAAASPEALHASRELHDQIRRSVSRLSPKAAEIFVLRYLEGYDNGEIAELVGTSKMVVTVLLHRARGRVRKDVGEFLGRNHE